ncbi:MAG: tetratricopeptide repeat protein [Candidatus Omnitrophica bacterium]|nr:tetratricopeptide repeat protein [Candidatus Omnitrophota bacterium]
MNNNSNKNAEIGSHLFFNNQYSRAIPYLQKALAEDPHIGYLLNYLATCQLYCFQDKEIALRTIDSAIQAEPDEADHYATKAQIVHQKEMITDTQYNKQKFVFINKALELDPKLFRAYLIKAEIYFKCRKYDDALENVKIALELRPENSYAQSFLGKLLRYKNARQDSEITTYRALSQNPNESELHENLAWLEIGRNNFLKAQEFFETALQLNPHNQEARKGLIETIKLSSPVYKWISSIFFNFGKQKHFIFFRNLYVTILFLISLFASIWGDSLFFSILICSFFFVLPAIIIFIDFYTLYSVWKKGRIKEGILLLGDKSKTVMFIDLFLLLSLTFILGFIIDNALFYFWGTLAPLFILHVFGTVYYDKLKRIQKLYYYVGLIFSLGLVFFLIQPSIVSSKIWYDVILAIGICMVSPFIVLIPFCFIDFLNQKHYLRPSDF